MKVAKRSFSPEVTNVCTLRAKNLILLSFIGHHSLDRLI